MNAFRKFRLLAVVGLIAVLVVGFAATSADAGWYGHGHGHRSFYAPSYNHYTPAYNSCYYPTYHVQPYYLNRCYTWPVTYLP